MTFITKCDGCGIQIGSGPDQRPLGIEGHTTGIYGRPAGDLHWCRGCAAIASKAVYRAQPTDAQAEVELIRRGMTEAKENPGKTVTITN